jgi:ribonuclease PH
LAVAIAFPRLAKEKKIDAPPVRKLVAAVSAGGLDSNAIVHLNCKEDETVTVDFNLVLTEGASSVGRQGLGRRIGV